MTTHEFRNQKIRNTRLAWQIYGQHFEGSFEDFTNEELRDIYHVEDSSEITSAIADILLKRLGADGVAKLL